jgi:hypothetical protein
MWLGQAGNSPAHWYAVYRHTVAVAALHTYTHTHTLLWLLLPCLHCRPCCTGIAPLIVLALFPSLCQQPHYAGINCPCRVGIVVICALLTITISSMAYSMCHHPRLAGIVNCSGSVALVALALSPSLCWCPSVVLLYSERAQCRVLSKWNACSLLQAHPGGGHVTWY